MRRLKLQMQLSVDGFVCGPKGEMDWMTWTWDEKLTQYVNELTDSVDTILLGRNMAPGFIQAWEERVKNPKDPNYYLAKRMVDYKKIFFSKTIKTIEGQNAFVENGDLKTVVENLKTQSGKDLVVYGGAGFVSSLIKEGLIDEFNFFVNPVMISRGMRIFDLNDKRQKLSFLSSTPYECGITVLTYKLNND